ncbi:MAG: peptidylprolyl isomerase, partial [Deltaproteobacteria bacterium]|nr:peptidylprolyl isomerase [Deltaproteobacteria bacterium]
EVSSVIQTSRGFHIIRVLDKRERQKMTKEEKWNEIENFLYNQKFENEFQQWVKKIRKRSYIKISL